MVWSVAVSTKEEIQDPSCDIKQKQDKLSENHTVDKLTKDSDMLTDKRLENKEKERVRGNSTIGSTAISSLKFCEGNEHGPPDPSNCFAYLKRIAMSLWIERVFLVIICSAVAAGFTVPIAIYAVDTDRENNTISTDIIDINNCRPSVSNTDTTKVCVNIYYNYSC